MTRPRTPLVTVDAISSRDGAGELLLVERKRRVADYRRVRKGGQRPQPRS